MSSGAKHNLNLEAAVAAAEARYIEANPKSRARFEAAQRNMPGGNTRSVLHYDPFPVTLVKGEEARVTDLDGHTYVDFLGEFTAGLYGHSPAAIVEAVRNALASGLVLGGPNQYEARLAELVCQRFPAVELVRFCNSGSEANLMCVSLARAVTNRPAVMAFNGGYHGGFLTFVNGGAPTNAPFPYVIGTYNDTAGAHALLNKHASELAAVIIEPLMGSGGCIPGDPEFLGMLRAECERHGIILIFDEVMTSRLSAGGLHGKLGIKPDLVAFGKYLGGGLTFGAFGGRRELMQRLDPTRGDAFVHSGTYNNNVLTMAAGVAGLEQVYTAEAAERLNASGDRLRERLNAVSQKHGGPIQVLGQGSMLCFHPHRAPISRPEDHASVSPELRKLMHLEMNQRGFYLARRGFISLSLPLSSADHDGLVSAFADYLEEYSTLLAP